MLERCDQQQWYLEVPAAVTRQWRYFSGTDRERVNNLESAWTDPTVDAVLTLGGGWGAARVLEAGFRFPQRAKWSLGFSDTSSLLLAQWAAGLPGAIHGSSGGSDAQWQRTVDLLCGRPVAPLQGEPRRRGIARGPLVVTNLTVATHLISTPWLPSLKGAVLVLEDVGEAPYRVDRMLTQWRSAGLLQHLAGVGCGRFSWAEDDILPGDFTMEEILEEPGRSGHSTGAESAARPWSTEPGLAPWSPGATGWQQRASQPDSLICERIAGASRALPLAIDQSN